jgi:hypothetical protein
MEEELNLNPISLMNAQQLNDFSLKSVLLSQHAKVLDLSMKALALAERQTLLKPPIFCLFTTMVYWHLFERANTAQDDAGESLLDFFKMLNPTFRFRIYKLAVQAERSAAAAAGK